MSKISVDEEQIKKLFKEAVVEVFEERKDLVQDAITEALEDIALKKAMEETESSKPVSREDVFRSLEGPA